MSLINMSVLQSFHLFSLLQLLLFLRNVATGNIQSLGNCVIAHNNEEFTFRSEINEGVFEGSKIYFSICDTLGSDGKFGVPNCKKNSKVCIIENANQRTYSAGFDFKIEGKGNLALRSYGGEKCLSDKTKSYSILVHLECNDMKYKPEFISHDNCTYEIEMMKPGCKRMCTELFDGSLIDLTPLDKTEVVTYRDKKFSIRLCGENTNCGKSGVSSCQILSNGKIIPLSLTGTQEVNFNKEKHMLYVKGKNEESGKGRRDFVLTVFCNWETEFSNITYKPKSKEGKKFDFEIHSRYGCVNVHQDCMIFNDYSKSRFNLSGLYNPKGFWNVTGFPKGQMLLNLCGNLELGSVQNKCTNFSAQVCEIHGNHFVSGGSSVVFDVTYDTIEAKITDGSVCEEKPGSNKQTIINLVCDAKDTGPYIDNIDNCTAYLKWKTPHACPHFYTVGEDCHFIDQNNVRRSLKPLSTDKSVKIEGYTLEYNICGNLESPCGNQLGGVSVCLSKPDGHSVIIGNFHDKIVNDNQRLTLQLDGEACNGFPRSQVIVNFVCDNSVENRKDHVNVIHDQCNYDITIYTPLACIPQSYYGSMCKTCHGNTCYDLNLLTRNNSNYIIKDDSSPGVEYILNMCASTYLEPDLLCHNSIVCVRNRTEINNKFRSRSLGGMSQLTVKNKSLMIQTSTGSTCGSEYYRSVIKFACSENNENLILLSKDQCSYEFLWKTKHACASSTCIFTDNATGKMIDLTHIEKNTFYINVTTGLTYHFDICKESYTKCKSDKCYLKPLSRSYENNYLRLFSGKGCFTDDEINISIHVSCEPLKDNDHLEVIQSDSCPLLFNLKTNTICTKGMERRLVQKTTLKPDHIKITAEKKLEYETLNESKTTLKPKHINTAAEKKLEDATPNESYSLSLQCTLMNPYSKTVYNSLIPSTSLNVGGRIYLIKWNQKLKDVSNCEKVTFNSTEHSLQTRFKTDITCTVGYYEILVGLKCDKLNTNIENSIDENNCSILIKYSTPELCVLLEHTVATSAAEVIGISLGIGLLIVAAILCIIRRKKGILPCRKLKPDELGEKEHIMVYCKNVQD